MNRAKEWFRNDKASSEWLESLKKKTRQTYQTGWKYFLEYAGMTGEQILESRKADSESLWEKKTLQFKHWLIEQKEQSEPSAKTATIAVRGFFAYHRVALKFRRAESAQLSEAKRKTEDYRFSREDLKKMADVADLEEKYVIVAGKSIGFRAGDFLALTRGDFEPYIDRPAPICIGPLTTAKEKVTAFPFIDSDAKPVIQLMLSNMDREGRTSKTDRLLTFKEEQLSAALQRTAKRAGINVGSKNVRFHCLRKFLTDRLSSFMSESKWKQIVGKKISEGAYVSELALREDYARAMAETCFTKAVMEGDIELLAKKQALIMLAKLQGMNEEEMKVIFRERKASTTPEQVKVLEELTEQKNQTNGGCPDGKHCGEYKQVSETELLSCLQDGWQIVHKLGSGEVIVKR